MKTLTGKIIIFEVEASAQFGNVNAKIQDKDGEKLKNSRNSSAHDIQKEPTLLLMPALVEACLSSCRN